MKSLTGCLFRGLWFLITHDIYKQYCKTHLFRFISMLFIMLGIRILRQSCGGINPLELLCSSFGALPSNENRYASIIVLKLYVPEKQQYRDTRMWVFRARFVVVVIVYCYVRAYMQFRRCFYAVI